MKTADAGKFNKRCRPKVDRRRDVVDLNRSFRIDMEPPLLMKLSHGMPQLSAVN